MYLDFARRIQQRDLRRHSRSREFLGLQPVSIGLLYPRSHKCYSNDPFGGELFVPKLKDLTHFKGLTSQNL